MDKAHPQLSRYPCGFLKQLVYQTLAKLVLWAECWALNTHEPLCSSGTFSAYLVVVVQVMEMSQYSSIQLTVNMCPLVMWSLHCLKIHLGWGGGVVFACFQCQRSSFQRLWDSDHVCSARNRGHSSLTFSLWVVLNKNCFWHWMYDEKHARHCLHWRSERAD